jgi:hypothetical protein
MVSPPEVAAGRGARRGARGRTVGRGRAAPALAAVAALLLSSSAAGVARQVTPSLDEQVAFLKSAKVVSAKPIGKGVTGALRLTLSNGTLTHDAAFQSIEQRASMNDIRAGKKRAGELRFADSYHYNIAAWELARLLDLHGMMPATTERSHGGKPGAISWWVDDVLMDEAERERTNAAPPGGQLLPMIHQRVRMLVFAELVRDTDRNKGNVLYTRDWQLIMLDFTRAFRLEPELRLPDRLDACDRKLLARLRTLTEEEVARAAGSHLTPAEVNAMMRRRDLIVAHFDRLIAERGEARVLF